MERGGIEIERTRETEREWATKSLFFSCWFFGVCSTLRQFKINWFPCLAECAGPKSVCLSVYLSVFCLEGAAQSVGRKRGKRTANWSAFGASPNFLHILCAVFHANEIIWKCLSDHPALLFAPTLAAAKGSSIIREQTIKQNGFLFCFYIYKFFFFIFFAFYSTQNLPNHQRDELVCVVGVGEGGRHSSWWCAA